MDYATWYVQQTLSMTIRQLIQNGANTYLEDWHSAIKHLLSAILIYKYTNKCINLKISHSEEDKMSPNFNV